MGNVVPLRSSTLNALVKQVQATWDRADEKKEDADSWYIKTGKLLIEIKEKCEHGQWLPTLEKLGRSQVRASELMQLARGTKTIEEQRSRARKGMQKTRANQRNVTLISKPAKPKPEPEPEEEDDTEQSLEERWQNSLANQCGDIIAISHYWDKEFPGWKKFDCPSHIKKLVKEAATALASITKTVI